MKAQISQCYWSCRNLVQRHGLSLLVFPVLGPLTLMRILLYAIRHNTLPRFRLRGSTSCYISPFASFLNPRNIHLGKGVGLAHQCYIWAGQTGTIRIGDHALVGPGAMVVAMDHRTGKCGVPIRVQGTVDASIVIGKNVWIGHNATVLKGVSIGDDAVIGAGAVVTHDVPAGAVCVGVPAKAVTSQ